MRHCETKRYKMRQTGTKSKSYNPFTPRFGKIPPEFVGDSFQEIFDEFSYSLDETEDGVGSCYMRISGQRGMGKTATIAELSRMALERGIRVIRTYSLDGFTKNIIDDISDDTVIRKTINPHIDIATPAGPSVSISGFSVEKEIRKRSSTLDAAFVEYFRHGGKDLLIVIDEVQDRSGDIDIDALGLSIQTLETTCPNSHVGVVFAGLPMPILDMSDIGKDKRATFLTRLDRYELTLSSDRQVAAMYRRAFSSGGKQIGQRQIEEMAHASGGYPYMMQCIGFEVWKASGDTVTENDVKKGIYLGEKRFFENVIMKIVGDMSDMEIMLLMALPDTELPIRLSSALSDSDMPRSSVSRARSALVKKGVLSVPKRGYVSCDIAYLIRYMKKYGGTLLSHRDSISNQAASL